MDHEISETVRTSIRREGTFDAIRKKARANLTEDGYVDELQSEMRETVENLVNKLPATWTKEQVRHKIKDYMSTEAYRQRIQSRIFAEVGFDWIKNQISDDLERKVRTAYGLPVAPLQGVVKDEEDCQQSQPAAPEQSSTDEQFNVPIELVNVKEELRMVKEEPHSQFIPDTKPDLR